MTSIRIRPRFREHSLLTPEEIQQKIHTAIQVDEPVCKALQVPGHTVLKIPAGKRHFWSPQLSLSFDREEDGKTLIRGLYGPNPTVWAIFTFGYGSIIVLGLFTLIYGMVRITLSGDGTFLWFLPVLAGIAVILYFVAQFGQKLGVEQTFELHHFFETSVGVKVSIS